MKKLWKNIKALSPVVAAIILIAVTVAVSIAVAAWMGALTFTFTKTEELKITGYTWTNNTQIVLTVVNTGQTDVTLSGAQIDDATAYYWLPGTASLTKGSTTTVTIRKSSAFTSGVTYNFAVLTATGNKYPYTAKYP